MLPIVALTVLLSPPSLYWQQQEAPVKAGDCFVARSETLVERVPCLCGGETSPSPKERGKS
jgi:hypothetical protein